MSPTTYPAEYDRIAKTIETYLDGCRKGSSALMRPAFHPLASFIGYAPDGTLANGTPFLYEWIDANGPAPQIKPRYSSVDIVETIAIVRLDVHNFTGKLAGSGVRMSDVFTLLKTPEGWRIVQKAFHWHA
jgi:hypothetical protein